ncbi:hypothetical protein VR41_10270 [Streptomyces sp. NRRL B-1568]|nr:hypothetical protein VR41_10270 [Streptomyces sp. NRRL B-1568]
MTGPIPASSATVTLSTRSVGDAPFLPPVRADLFQGAGDIDDGAVDAGLAVVPAASRQPLGRMPYCLPRKAK